MKDICLLKRPRLICPFLIFSREISMSPGSWGFGRFDSAETTVRLIGLRNVFIFTPFLSTLQRRFRNVSSFAPVISLIWILFPITSTSLSRNRIYEWTMNEMDIENNNILHYSPDPELIHFIVKGLRQIENSSNCMKSNSATFPPSLEFDCKRRRLDFVAKVWEIKTWFLDVFLSEC